ncbi:hypothetical protein FRB94_003539 [Tulasnella sp. JGI-2019a]|nr:hypothetical protein FRB94_003539 [Tulasnella sp. JGI-2019a]
MPEGPIARRVRQTVVGSDDEVRELDFLKELRDVTLANPVAWFGMKPRGELGFYGYEKDFKIFIVRALERRQYDEESRGIQDAEAQEESSSWILVCTLEGRIICVII